MTTQDDVLKTEYKKIAITGFFTVIASVVATIISFFLGKSFGESQGQQVSIELLNNTIASVQGNYNTVNINSVDELVELYLELIDENEMLKEKNDAYFSENSNLKETVKEYSDFKKYETEYKQLLESTLDELKLAEEGIHKYTVSLHEKDMEIDRLNSIIETHQEVRFVNTELWIDGEKSLINSVGSQVCIDGNIYFSQELFRNLIPENKSMVIKNDNVYVGKIIEESTKLSKQYVMDNLRTDLKDSAIDTFGNIYSDCIVLNSGLYDSASIKFNTEEKYSMLKCTLAVMAGTDRNDIVEVIIKADDTVIYTVEMRQDTKAIELDLPIGNCNTLTIIKDKSDYSGCIIAGAILYN